LEKYNTSFKLSSLILRFILKPYVFLNIHISIISVGIVYLNSVFCDSIIDSDFYLLVFSSTFSYYNFHWFISNRNPELVREKWSYKNSILLLVSSIIGFSISVFVLINHSSWIQYFIPTILSGIAYTLFSSFLFKQFTPRFKALYISVFWVYTLIFCPILVFGFKDFSVVLLVCSSTIVFAYTFTITLLFELRDLSKNEFNIDPDALKNEKSKILYLRTEILILLLLALSFNFTLSILFGLLHVFVYCLFVFTILKAKNQKEWMYYDLILDSFLLLSMASNLLFLL
jgi:hypothetical protein